MLRGYHKFNSKSLDKEIQAILNKYDVKIKIRIISTKKWGNVCGFCMSDLSSIVINKNLSRHNIISTLFHELGHVHCVKTGKYKKYHQIVKNKKQLHEKINQAIRAERYVDKWGKRECEVWNQKIVWIPTYFSKEDVKWYKEYWAPKILKDKSFFYANLH